MFSGAVVYRLLITPGLINDQFGQLAWAHQLLSGEIPVRDFVDPGMPLTYVVTALAQAVLGHTPLAEIVLCVTALSLAAAISFALTARLTASIWCGLAATALQLVIVPRLYSYPKLLLPVVAMAICWYYAKRPNTARLFLLAVYVAGAFLFRHDFGFTAGVAVGALLCAVHWHEPGRLCRQAVTGAALGVGHGQLRKRRGA